MSEASTTTLRLLYQIAQHDGMLPGGAIDKAIPRTPRAEVRHYPMGHFGPFSPEHHPAVATHAATSSAPTGPDPWRAR